MSESLSSGLRCFPCWSAGRTKAPCQCLDTRSLEDAVGHGVRWVCWELLLRTEVSSPRAGVNSRRCPCLLIAEPSGPFLKILSPSGCSGHLVTAAETPRKEGDSTARLLTDSSCSRFSGKGAGEQSEGNVKKVRQETVHAGHCSVSGALLSGSPELSP